MSTLTRCAIWAKGKQTGSNRLPHIDRPIEKHRYEYDAIAARADRRPTTSAILQAVTYANNMI